MKRKLTLDFFEGAPTDVEGQDDMFQRELERIVPMLADGYTSGQLYGEEPAYRGWWTLEEVSE